MLCPPSPTAGRQLAKMGVKHKWEVIHTQSSTVCRLDGATCRARLRDRVVREPTWVRCGGSKMIIVQTASGSDA